MKLYSIRREALKGTIRNQGLKKWWVAESAGIHQSTLKRWLSGRIGQARIANLTRIAGVLGVGLPEICAAQNINAPSLEADRHSGYFVS